ncbi:hypothetical protein QYN14_26570 (plasmid) [Rhodococcus ruber]|uniref:hypothetical protein n=1 Tax=Rhodococcus ruber TaxID=1830 RepID=UPI0026592577|nr:hypothetical protein [Rhodococcus ruber]WKK14868.1 hypothetical protein QYN14_26570 [Rhodococcus ruber]
MIDSKETDVLSLDELCSFRLPSFGFESTRRVVEPDDVATLIYTSGTTGPPNLNLSRGSRAGLSGFGLDTETVDPVCIHGRLPDTVG